MTKPSMIMVTVFGLGHSPVASGTVGSLPPAIIAALLAIIGAGARAIDITMAAIGLVFAFSCVVWGRQAETTYGRKDPGAVVADEVAGQCLVLLALPWRTPSDDHFLAWNIALAVLAFLLFRVFDVLKPPPINALQRIGGGLGILLDDLLAGLYAWVITQLVARLFMPMILPATVA
jgi:phosphatidylglycerophosphatase A